MQPDIPENSRDIATVSAALEATREALKLTREQLAEANERESRLLAIVESQARLPGQQPPIARKVLFWVAALSVMGLTGVGALWWWQATKATATDVPPATEVAPHQSTTPPPPKPNEGRTPTTRPKKRSPPVPRPGEVRIPGGLTNWCFFEQGTHGVKPAYKPA